jgi:hypothetical protein
MTEAPINKGILTDKEGTGFPGRRILVDREQADTSFTVMPFVQKYLDNIPKKARVCFQSKENKIVKLWEDKPATVETVRNVADQTAKQEVEKGCTSSNPPAPAAKDEWTEEREEFCNLLTATGREGISALLQHLIEKTDFFLAPSSMKYHDARDGGLLHHSMKVYYNLVELSKLYEIEIPADGSSLAIIALLHDVCKTDIYKKERKSLPRRNDKTGELLLDDYGKKIWDEQIVFTVDDPLPLGHGEKSVIMLQRFIQLTDTEIFAIRWHMMAYDDSRNSYAGNLAITNASDKFRIIPLVHAADLLASFLEMKPVEGVQNNG